MQTVQYNQLVALPFNAAASRTRQHKDCPTFGMPRADLWKSTFSMMMECWNEYGNFSNHISHQCRLDDRFRYCEWKPERIKRERDKFLAHESREHFASTLGNSRRRGFIVLDTTQGKVVGEIHLTSLAHAPKVASPYDMVTSSERGKGLAKDFMQLGCRIALELGFNSMDIGVGKTNTASNKRMVQAVQQGWAEERMASRDGFRYWIDLQKFSARCG